jgi:phage shock protein A
MTTPDPWAIIAELRGQVAELRGQVAELRGQLADAEQRIRELDPGRQLAEYEADLAAADLAESGYGW